MNKNIMRAALVALCLATAGSAMAQQHDDHDNRRGDERRGDERGNNEQRGNYEQRGRNDRYDYARHDEGPRGAGPRHDMYRGRRLPDDYRSRQYVVDDWRGHRLSPPPRGYHWVQAGGDYVLVAIASGIIADILLNH